MTQRQISEAFSIGHFDKVYMYLADDIEWNVINNYRLKNKKQVIDQCEKVAEYFSTIDTDFQQLDIIEDENKIAITGTSKFSKNGERIECISSCDVYEFIENKLQKITSYCVVEK